MLEGQLIDLQAILLLHLFSYPDEGLGTGFKHKYATVVKSLLSKAVKLLHYYRFDLLSLDSYWSI